MQVKVLSQSDSPLKKFWNSKGTTSTCWRSQTMEINIASLEKFSSLRRAMRKQENLADARKTLEEV
jgi:hypothetical protein